MEKVNARKVFLVIIIILILLVIALFIGKFTFSYLAPDVGEDASNKGEITASGDTIIFNTGKALSLSATADNFTTGGTNLTDTSNPTAKLVASSKTNKADATYYVGVYIKNNTYTYSTTDKTPEVLLTIKDEKGNNVTSVDGLTYATSGGVSGFDITDKTGLFNVKTDYPISTTSSSTGTTHTWTFTLTFVNLSTDQSVNENANMNIDVYLQTKPFPSTVADVCSGGETLASCITTLSQKSISQATNIYYHDANLTNGAGDNSYRYSGGNAHGALYSCKYDGNDVMNKNSEINAANEGDCLNVYRVTNGNNIMYDNSFGDLFTNKQSVSWDSSNNECVTSSGDNVSLLDGSTVTQDACTGTAYYLTLASQYILGIEEVGAGEETLITLADEGVSNFVCFGSSASPCPTDNLYRIIGVFGDKVKLIKYDYANSNLLGTDGDYSTSTYSKSSESRYKGSMTTINKYYWNSKATNAARSTWSTSLLNKTNLNTNFITNIGTEWANKIATTTWKVGGNVYANIASKIPSVVYQNEIVNPVTTNTTDNATEYTAKIGLMYVSDYGFAADPSAWTTTLYDYDGSVNGSTIRSLNWMYMGLTEWTISRYADDSNRAFYVFSTGGVNGYYVSYSYGVRPSFNLESSVTYVSGSGSADDPMVIN